MEDSGYAKKQIGLLDIMKEIVSFDAAISPNIYAPFFVSVLESSKFLS
jgi:hypothetical protein